MSKKIFALAVLCATSAFGANVPKFGDVNYFLKAGQFNVKVDESSAYNKELSEFANKTLETRGYLTSAVASYGWTDELSLSVGLDYAYDFKVRNRTSGATDTTYNQDGFSDPALGADYRLFKQSNFGVNWDFGAVAKLSMQESELGEASGQVYVDGNHASGRSSIELNTRVGQKYDEANEWQVAGGLVTHLSGGYKDLNVGSPDVDVDLGSSFDVFARVTYQYRPVNEFMMLVSWQTTRVGETDLSSQGADFTLQSRFDSKFLYTAKYQILDGFIAKFNYGISQNGDIDAENNSTGVVTSVRKRHENFFGLGAEFLF